MRPLALLIVLFLVVGCARPGGGQPLQRSANPANAGATTPPPKITPPPEVSSTPNLDLQGSPTSAQQGTATEGQVVAPKLSDICLKPEDNSGILVDLLKYNTGHGWRAKPGWVITIRATTIPAVIHFPRGVDRSTVQLSVEPSYWQVEPDPVGFETDYRFWLLPDGKRQELGKPGWITLTVSGARDKEGKPVSGVPFTVKMFAYDSVLQGAYPYLPECLGTLAIHTSGD